jgi:mannose/fructose/N-acetylgalactosamine-specific phosphotransferase system component IID
MNIHQSKIIPYLAAGATLLTPLAVFAQGDVDSVLSTISRIMNRIVPMLLGLAVIFFIWTLVKYMLSQGDEDGKKEARSQMFNGIIVIAVMLGVWGLAAILLNTFGINQSGPSVIPTIPGGRF